MAQAGGVVTEAEDRSDEMMEWYAEDDIVGAKLLDAIAAFLARFVSYPSEHARYAPTCCGSFIPG